MAGFSMDQTGMPSVAPNLGIGGMNPFAFFPALMQMFGGQSGMLGGGTQFAQGQGGQMFGPQIFGSGGSQMLGNINPQIFGNISPQMFGNSGSVGQPSQQWQMQNPSFFSNLQNQARNMNFRDMNPGLLFGNQRQGINQARGMPANWFQSMMEMQQRNPGQKVQPMNLPKFFNFGM